MKNLQVKTCEGFQIDNLRVNPVLVEPKVDICPMLPPKYSEDICSDRP